MVRDSRRPAGHIVPYILMILFVCVAGCASRQSAGAPTPAAAPADDDTTVTLWVDNRGWQDIVIYVVHDGSRNRLGMVGAAKNAKFTLPTSLRSQGGEMYFVADPIGDLHRFASERVLVQPGQYIEWTLENGLERSSILVR